MFEKKNQRFLTQGIKEGVPLEVQLLLWHLIDGSIWKKDYLQIFELYKENHIQKLIIVHRQEQPEYRRTSGNIETLAFVECRFLYRLPQSSFVGPKPICKRYSIYQKTTILLRAVEY